MTKAEDRRRQQQADRPGERVEQDVDDGARIIGDRVAEIEPGHVAEIVEVLPPERLVEPKLPLVLLDHLVDAALDVAAGRRLLHQLLAHWILAGDARQEEVQRRRRPDDGDEEGKALNDVGSAHGISPSYRLSAIGYQLLASPRGSHFDRPMAWQPTDGEELKPITDGR